MLIGVSRVERDGSQSALMIWRHELRCVGVPVGGDATNGGGRQVVQDSVCGCGVGVDGPAGRGGVADDHVAALWAERSRDEGGCLGGLAGRVGVAALGEMAEPAGASEAAKDGGEHCPARAVHEGTPGREHAFDLPFAWCPPDGAATFGQPAQPGEHRLLVQRMLREHRLPYGWGEL